MFVYSERHKIGFAIGHIPMTNKEYKGYRIIDITGVGNIRLCLDLAITYCYNNRIPLSDFTVVSDVETDALSNIERMSSLMALRSVHKLIRRSREKMVR